MRAAGDLLARALEQRGACRILASRERAWASATFTGTQHRLRMMVADAAFLDGIEEGIFDLGAFLLADLVVIERLETCNELAVVIEALTIEDKRAPMPPETDVADGGTQPMAPALARARQGQTEPLARTSCGTKRAFLPLAAA